VTGATMPPVAGIDFAGEPCLSGGSDDDVCSQGRREQRKQEMRGRITKAAIELFAERGCEETTVEEICAGAEVARKTFYNYFPTRRHLIGEIAQALLFDETRALVELAVERHIGTRQRLAFFCEAMRSNFSRFELLERSLIQHTLLDLSVDSARSRDQLHRLNQAFLSMLADGRERGDIEPGQDVAFLAEMVVAAMNGVILNWIHDPAYPILRRTRDLADFLQRAICGPG